jgi:hypothetical protein
VRRAACGRGGRLSQLQDLGDLAPYRDVYMPNRAVFGVPDGDGLSAERVVRVRMVERSVCT